MAALQHGLDRRERADAAGDRLRDAGELQRQFGDDAERALRADDQAGQVVAGRGFLGAPRRGHHLAVRHHHFERQHVVLHRAVAHRVGAGAARRRHAAERGVGAGIDREEQALVAQIFVERLAGDAGLDHAVEVLGVHRQHLVHVAEVDRDAAVRRVDVAFERGAGAERDDRHADAPRRCGRSPARPRSICGNTTASGGWFSIQVTVLPCCSRTACEVTTRLPNFAASAPSAASIGLASRGSCASVAALHRH